jgi:hypothetical protein
MTQEINKVLITYGEYVKAVQSFVESTDESVRSKLIDFSIIEQATADLGEQILGAQQTIQEYDVQEKRTKEYQNSYGVFIIADRLQYFKSDYGLDELWDEAVELYLQFLDSDFNVDTKSAMWCINDFLEHNELL